MLFGDVWQFVARFWRDTYRTKDLESLAVNHKKSFQWLKMALSSIDSFSIENDEVKCAKVQNFLANNNAELTFAAFDSIKLFEYGRDL